MSYDHIRAVAKRFNGALAARMVLTAFAVHADPKTGISTVSIDGIADFIHMNRSNVRRIVRSLEGSQDAEMAEPGCWLYPIGKRSMSGDGQRTCYRMFLDAQTAPVRRAPRNPSGKNQRTPVTVTGVQGPVTGTPPGVSQTSDPGYPNPATPVTGTGKSIERLKAPKPNPYPEYVRYLVEVRRSGADPLTLADWLRQGASPPHPQPGQGKAVEESDLPPGHVQMTLDHFIEPAIITEHQETSL